MANNPTFAPDFETQQLQQKQAMAQALMQQGMQNNGGVQMVGPVAVGQSPVAGIANMLGAYLGGKMNRDATQQLGQLSDQRRKRTAQILQQGFEQGKSGDTWGAIQTLSSDPSTAPYAQEILKTQLGNKANNQYGLTPTYFKDKDGNLHAVQLSSGGGAQELKVNDGWIPAQDIVTANQGGTTAIIGKKTGQVVNQLDKTVDPNNIYNQGQQTERQLNEPAIAIAKAQGTAKVDRQQADIDKANTLKYYETAREGLVKGLEGTSTGYIQGKLPAVTTGQQIAEGGVSAMAPVLKQLFRQAGEGTFTDKDQQLLLNMLPTRSDTPEAAKAKLSNIDALIRQKLAPTSSVQPHQPKDTRLKFNPATGNLE